MNYGIRSIDDTLTFTVNCHAVDTGVATDPDGAPTYRVYEDETGTALLNGSMAKLDDANTTGFYSEQITLSAANGFEVGKSYTIYAAATVGGVTGTLSHCFQVENIKATAVADAVWDEASTGHTDAGKAGAQLWTDIDAILADTGTDGVLLAGAAVDAVLDDVVEGSVTLRQALRLLLSFATGKCSGGGTATITFRDIGDTKDRIVATVDEGGNRTAIGTRDGS